MNFLPAFLSTSGARTEEPESLESRGVMPAQTAIVFKLGEKFVVRRPKASIPTRIPSHFLCPVPFFPKPRVSPAMRVYGIAGDASRVARIRDFAMLAEGSEKRFTPDENFG